MMEPLCYTPNHDCTASVPEQLAVPYFNACKRSPKSVELPVLAIVTCCIVFTSEPVSPPKVNPLVGLAQAAGPYTLASKSPKSVAFPVLAIVIYSMGLLNCHVLQKIYL